MKHAGGLTILLAAVVVAGAALRFVNLADRLYWHDEVYTSLRISGYRVAEVKQAMLAGGDLRPGDLLPYQRLNREHGFSDSIASLAADDPQISPLYIALIRLWAGLAGDSVRSLRVFSALVSLLVFPCLFWLCRELFPTIARTDWVAAALIAVSPFHLLYAQQVREYSLWTATMLLASAALLRALRRGNRSAWGWYAATVALGLYTHLFFGLVMVAHGVYLLGLERRWSPVVRNYLLATVAGLVAFGPWLANLGLSVTRARAATDWSGDPRAAVDYLQRFVSRFGSIFFEISYGVNDPFTVAVRAVIVLGVLYALVRLVRREKARCWGLLLALLIIPAAPLVLPDLLFGGQRGLVHRYVTPAYLAAELAVAYLFAARLGQRIWQVLFALVVAGGLASEVVITRAECWWTAGHNLFTPAIIRSVNQCPRPLVVTEFVNANFGDMLVLSHRLHSQVRLRVGPPPVATTGYSDVFVYGPPASRLAELRQNGYERHPDVLNGLLWKRKP